MEAEGLQTLSGKRVFLTGGTTGIGLATAKHLLSAGAKLFTFSRDPRHVEEAKTALPGATVEQGDQSDEKDVQRLVDAAEGALGGFDAVIVNAGEGASSVLDMPVEAWHQVIHANLVGPMQLAGIFAPKLEVRGGGAIVFVGSLSAKTRDEGSDVYVAAKTGLRGFADSFGRGVAEKNVRVCLVEPGKVWTELNKEETLEENEAQVRKGIALHADDIARTILFVLSQPDRVDIPLVQVRPRMQLI